MADYWFYHLEGSTLESVLPDLLQKTRAKGWRAMVKLPAARLPEMDHYLWTFRDNSFLPHGRDDEPQADQQPILLTASATKSQGADCVFLIEGEEMDIARETQRCIVMINGRNQDDVMRARAQWKKLKDTGAALSYWQQTGHGRWEKKA